MPFRISFLFWIAVSLVRAQPSTNYQVLWERDFASFSDPFFLQGAGADGQGDLWVLTSALLALATTLASRRCFVSTVRAINSRRSRSKHLFAGM